MSQKKGKKIAITILTVVMLLAMAFGSGFYGWVLGANKADDELLIMKGKVMIAELVAKKAEEKADFYYKIGFICTAISKRIIAKGKTCDSRLIACEKTLMGTIKKGKKR